MFVLTSKSALGATVPGTRPTEGAPTHRVGPLESSLPPAGIGVTLPRPGALVPLLPGLRGPGGAPLPRTLAHGESQDTPSLIHCVLQKFLRGAQLSLRQSGEGHVMGGKGLRPQRAPPGFPRAPSHLAREERAASQRAVPAPRLSPAESQKARDSGEGT